MENYCLITLLEKFKQGDMTVFPILFGEFEGLIRFYSQRLDGEDDFQELSVGFLELLYKINISAFKADQSDSLQRYIAVSIRNRYINIAKRNSVRKITTAPLFEEYAPVKEDLCMIQILKDALADLPPKQRRIITYKYIYNFSDGQIADYFNISPQAVSQLKGRALKNLRNYYFGEL